VSEYVVVAGQNRLCFCFIIDDKSKDEDNPIDKSNYGPGLTLTFHSAYPDNCCGEEVNPTNTIRTAAYPNVDAKI
jgi:hypothetical protein